MRLNREMCYVVEVRCAIGAGCSGIRCVKKVVILISMRARSIEVFKEMNLQGKTNKESFSMINPLDFVAR